MTTIAPLVDSMAAELSLDGEQRKHAYARAHDANERLVDAVARNR